MWLALVGTLFGCIIGFLVGIVQTIPVDKNDSTAKKVIIKVVKFIMACYVEFFRGTPMMAQAMFIFLEVPIYLSSSEHVSCRLLWHLLSVRGRLKEYHLELSLPCMPLC